MGELKNRGYINTTIPLEQIDQIRRLSKNTGMPISRLIEEALKDFLKKNFNKKSPIK